MVNFLNYKNTSRSLIRWLSNNINWVLKTSSVQAFFSQIDYIYFNLFFKQKSLNYRTWPAPAFIVASIRILCVQSFGRQVGVHMVPIILLDMGVHDCHQFAALGGQVLNHVHAV